MGLSELVRVAVEHWVGDFKLDILCTDGDDQVVIENQLEKTNHSPLGQLIAYAAGVGAKKPCNQRATNSSAEATATTLVEQLHWTLGDWLEPDRQYP